MSVGSGPMVIPWRRTLVLILVACAMGALLVRAVYLQHYESDFLQGQGDARHLRVVSMPAHRGVVTDRRGEPLAVSTPVESVWANPSQALESREQLGPLARILELDPEVLVDRLVEYSGREFVYLKRHLGPVKAGRVKSLGIAGVNIQREYRRYYPAGEVTAHVLGFTDIDDHGQEGIELAYDDWLGGRPGAKRVVRDRLGRVIDDVELIRAPEPGRDLRLSLDRRIQYLAYRELKAAIKRNDAVSGSVVVLDPRSGEILAMVNQPSFNPNRRAGRGPGSARNRAVTDVFEPGSTIKPFTVVAALESGLYTPASIIDTAPGWYRVRHHTVRDMHDYGRLSLGRILVKSSNVGASKLALAIPADSLWQVYRKVGFGLATESGFPGEAGGVLTEPGRWREVERATLSFGYGLSVTALQLAQAYGVLAADGRLVPATFLAVETPAPGTQVMSPYAARTVRHMLEGVVSPEGTAIKAAVRGYRVAGKTGTVHKSAGGGYAEHRYVSLFAGMAPASAPALVIVVHIDEPRGQDHFGGLVAAPVFARVMDGALRMLNVPPDDLPALQAGSGDQGDNA